MRISQESGEGGRVGDGSIERMYCNDECGPVTHALHPTVVSLILDRFTECWSTDFIHVAMADGQLFYS